MPAVGWPVASMMQSMCGLAASAAGRDLYLVGGAWRALARVHMQHAAYRLGIVHHYAIPADAARDLANPSVERRVRRATRKG